MVLECGRVGKAIVEVEIEGLEASIRETPQIELVLTGNIFWVVGIPQIPGALIIAKVGVTPNPMLAELFYFTTLVLLQSCLPRFGSEGRGKLSEVVA